MKRLAIVAALLILPGCTAVNTVTSIATAPVRAATTAASAGSTLVDATTTSQSERDEKRGRALRLEEERLGQLERNYRRQTMACDHGDEEACARSNATWRELQALTSGQSQPEE